MGTEPVPKQNNTRRREMGKNNEYLEISKQIVANIGGMDNIQGTAHCATRLRIVLKDNDLADIEKMEDQGFTYLKKNEGLVLFSIVAFCIT